MNTILKIVFLTTVLLKLFHNSLNEATIILMPKPKILQENKIKETCKPIFFMNINEKVLHKILTNGIQQNILKK